MRKPRTFFVRGIAVLVLLSLVPGTAGATGSSAPQSPVDPLTPLWQPVSDTLATAEGARRQVDPDEFVAYTLDRAGMQTRLAQAPSEDSSAALLVMSLPDPTGGFIRAVARTPTRTWHRSA